MTPCLHCASAPERRQSPTSSMIMWICPVCNHRGEASSSEAYSAATWEQANNPELPLYQFQGRPRFYQRGGLWGVRCTITGAGQHGYHSLSGAVAGWHRLCRH